ncbi:MAG: hypothetical protein R3D84_05495 [Paracoccaceae bacterium]
MRLPFLVFFCLTLVLKPAFAETETDRILTEAAAACTDFENGTFAAGDAVTSVDLTGDDQPDTVIDSAKFTCSSAATMYCGTGGCSLYAVVGDQRYEWQALGWKLVDWAPDRILLIGRDGGWCGGAGFERCFEALNWSEGRFLTAMPPFEEAQADAQGEDSTNLTWPYSTPEYDATGLLACSLDAPTHELTCAAGAKRAETGSATIHMMSPDGVERVLEFADGKVRSPDEVQTDWSKDGDAWYVGLDGREFYVVPDAFVTGG